MLSQLIVLWFSRTREFYADRFAGKYSSSPSALARALVKIGYGLASHGGTATSGRPPNSPDSSKLAGAVGFSALNIFDKNSALNLVVTAQVGAHDGGFDQEVLKGALQWDLWNPWATFFEIQSTHPLIAKRLEYLGDQSASLDQQPFVVFDREKPESYWDEFFLDVVVTTLPLLTLLFGLGALVFSSLNGSVSHSWYPALIIVIGASSMLKTYLSYRGGDYTESNVATLLQEVKVSPVRPVPTTIRGTVVGKGVPGLIWSEDFVIHDGTGIILLDYRQPFRFWEFFFGLLRARDLQGKDVIVEGWYRRAPIPFVEIGRITEVSEMRTRRCYVKIAKLASGVALTALGIILTISL
jgi:heat shock protein HtpX